MKKATVSPEHKPTSRMSQVKWQIYAHCCPDFSPGTACNLTSSPGWEWRADGCLEESPSSWQQDDRTTHNDCFSVSNLLEQLQSPSSMWKTMSVRTHPLLRGLISREWQERKALISCRLKDGVEIMQSEKYTEEEDSTQERKKERYINNYNIKNDSKAKRTKTLLKCKA